MVVVFTRKLWVSAQCCVAVLNFQFCILLSPFDSFSRTLGNVLRCRLFIMKACIHLGYSTVTVTKQILTVTADHVLEGNTCAKQNLPKTTAVTHQFLRPATGYGRDRMVRIPVSSEGQHGQAVSLFPTVPSACQGAPFAGETLASATPTTGGQGTTGATVLHRSHQHAKAGPMSVSVTAVTTTSLGCPQFIS